jgi:copper chaperone CopZ
MAVADQKALKLSIDGMHCDGCVGRLTRVLTKMEGVEIRHVQVGSAELIYDAGRLTPGQICEAIDKLGFLSRQS